MLVSFLVSRPIESPDRKAVASPSSPSRVASLQTERSGLELPCPKSENLCKKQSGVGVKTKTFKE